MSTFDCTRKLPQQGLALVFKFSKTFIFRKTSLYLYLKREEQICNPVEDKTFWKVVFSPTFVEKGKKSFKPFSRKYTFVLKGEKTL